MEKAAEKRVGNRRTKMFPVIIAGSVTRVTKAALLEMEGWVHCHGKFKGYAVNSLHILESGQHIFVRDEENHLAMYKISDLVVAMPVMRQMLSIYTEPAVAPI